MHFIIDKFSKDVWCVPSKNKNDQTKVNEFLKNLTGSKRKPTKLESDRAAEVHNIVFQKFLKVKIIHHYSQVTDKCPSIAERVIRATRNLLRNLHFWQAALL